MQLFLSQFKHPEINLSGFVFSWFVYPFKSLIICVKQSYFLVKMQGGPFGSVLVISGEIIGPLTSQLFTDTIQGTGNK